MDGVVSAFDPYDPECPIALAMQDSLVTERTYGRFGWTVEYLTQRWEITETEATAWLEEHREELVEVMALACLGSIESLLHKTGYRERGNDCPLPVKERKR